MIKSQHVRDMCVCVYMFYVDLCLPLYSTSWRVLVCLGRSWDQILSGKFCFVSASVCTMAWGLCANDGKSAFGKCGFLTCSSKCNWSVCSGEIGIKVSNGYQNWFVEYSPHQGPQRWVWCQCSVWQCCTETLLYGVELSPTGPLWGFPLGQYSCTIILFCWSLCAALNNFVGLFCAVV